MADWENVHFRTHAHTTRARARTHTHTHTHTHTQMIPAESIFFFNLRKEPRGGAFVARWTTVLHPMTARHHTTYNTLP